jgi:hypothetical protein
MGMLHDRMEGDLKLRGWSLKTQRCYLSCARQFVAHYHRSPAEMGEREITDFLRHLVQEREAAPPTIHMYVAGLRFLYKVLSRGPKPSPRSYSPRCRGASRRSSPATRSSV